MCDILYTTLIRVRGHVETSPPPCRRRRGRNNDFVDVRRRYEYVMGREISCDGAWYIRSALTKPSLLT